MCLKLVYLQPFDNEYNNNASTKQVEEKLKKHIEKLEKIRELVTMCKPLFLNNDIPEVIERVIEIPYDS